MYSSFELRGEKLYQALSAPNLEATERFKMIVAHKDEIIYDSALTNQKTIGEKLDLQQSQMSLLIKILKVL